MSIVIVGGNDRMVCQYKEICKQHQCKVKVFTQMTSSMRSQIGSPDLMVLFTGTVSHKMIWCATQEISGSDTVIARSHSSSSCALKNILKKHCPCCNS
ncbi:DUF2325 domain-containing protein [Oscillospiraceae bacterium PP1C4]